MIWSDSSQSTSSSHSSYSCGILQGVDPSDRVQSKEIQVKLWPKLADAALRTIIGGSSTMRTDGVKLSSDSGGPKLAEIAPALFSPFYAVVSTNFETFDAKPCWPNLMKRQTLTQRSMLFPTISRGLSAIYGRIQSADLKGLIDQLTQLSLDERLLLTRNDPDFEKHGRTFSSLNAIVKLRLWRLAQRALFDPQATRRLKPTRHVGGLFLHGIVAEAMLDGVDLTNAQLGEMPLADECDYGSNSGYIDRSTEMDEMAGIEDNGSLLVEGGDNCFDNMLDMNGSAEPGEEMLDGPFLGFNVICDDEELLWDDEILDKDTDEFEELLLHDPLEVHTDDLDTDLFWND